MLSILANHWAHSEHRVSLITLSPTDAVPFYELDSRINLIQLGLNAPDNQSTFLRLKNLIQRILKLRSTLKDLGPDLIVSFMDRINMTTLLSTTGLNIPIIASERSHPKYNPLPALFHKVRDRLYPRAARVVVQTESASSFFEHLTNMTVIPNPVIKPEKIKGDVTQPVQNIVSVGRLCPFKGFDTLIRSFANLLPRHPQLSLTIYGEGQERKNLEHLIHSLGLEANVHLPGTTKAVSKALFDADLFIFPSHFEGFPNALCEAMATGLPVIASNCSGSVDIVREGVDGRLFPIGDAETLTRIALELLDDPGQRQRLSDNAKTISQRFSSKSVFALWDQVLTETIRT